MLPKAISTYLFRHEPLRPPLLDQIVHAGFRRLEIHGSRQHFDYTDPKQVRELADWFGDSSLELHSVHAPLSRDPSGDPNLAAVSIAFLERRHRQESLDECKRALEVAERIPFRYMIFHLGVPNEEFDLRKFDAALTSLEHLRLFAGQRDVQVLVENIPNDLSSPLRLLQFFRHTHLKDLRVCFDTGHAMMEGGVQEAFDRLKDFIASTHLHDNNGEKDEHLFPLEGKIAWKELIRSLREQLPDVPLLLEVRGNGDARERLDQANQVFDQFQRFIDEGQP